MDQNNPDEKLLLKIGIKYRSGSLREIVDRSFLPFLPLDIKIDIFSARAEMAEACKKAEVISKGISSAWSYLSLFGPQYTTSTKTMRLLSEAGQSGWNEVPGVEFPSMKKLVAELPFEKIYSVQLLKLGPAGYVQLHSDNFNFGLHTMVISLQEPLNSVFNFPTVGIVPFVEGQPVMIDTAFFHETKNSGTVDRLHIQIYGKLTEDSATEDLFKRSVALIESKNKNFRN